MTSLQPDTSESDSTDDGPPPGFGMGTPYPGDWTATTMYQDSLFTIEHPASARVEPRPANERYGQPYPQLFISALPECKWHCGLTIVVRRDSTRDLLARIVKQTQDPEPLAATDMPEGPDAFIDSLPLGADPAVHTTTHCGDCTSFEINTTRYPWVARIEYSLDDREGLNPALAAKLAAVARTFRWRR
jgi:hypothetical protein